MTTASSTPTDLPLSDLPIEVFEALAAMAILISAGYDPDDVLVDITPDADTKKVSVGVRPPGGAPTTIRWVGIARSVLRDDVFLMRWGLACARYNALSPADRKRVVEASTIQDDAAQLLTSFAFAGVPPPRVKGVSV